MGTYLYYKLENDSDLDHIKQANKFVNQLDEQQELETLSERTQRVAFFEEDIYPGLGAGSIKTNAIESEHHDKAMELYTKVFEMFHEHDQFNVKILSRSCSVSPLTFSPEQLLRITDHGNALSGEKKQLYQKSLEKWKSINPYPSRFVSAFNGSESIEPTLSNLDAIDLTENEKTELKKLFDGENLPILDLILTFPDNFVPVSLIESQTSLTADEIKNKLAELQSNGVTNYGRAYIPDEYHLREELVTIHDSICDIQTQQL